MRTFEVSDGLFLVMFLWPVVALLAFAAGGVWTWVFLPVLLGFGVIDYLSYRQWKRDNER